MQFLTRSKYYFVLAITAVFGFSFLSGCDDSGVENPPVTPSYVVHFDSIGVTDGIGNVMNSINLYNGTTVERDSASKDVNLTDDPVASGSNYLLRSGDLTFLNTVVPGFQTRFNRIYASMTQAEFDTITVLPVGRDTILPDLDFTSDDTYAGGAWGYFNAPMSTADSKPVYSFWLKGKSANFLGVQVYGILYPREAEVVGGVYRMSFEVRINTRGLNDFHHGSH
ncbi:MAG TPA: hypothetical protein PK605_02545 [Ignavibacteria bacterium]|nr:hypothetical protein [Ignavibacteria bacterium]HRE11958.1 hypothetical protein [Ignavibacteria bacterium]HRF65810.1 hypothetical protein [Ignavibacteria bacterium]HRJ03261.1 hypothetical protein [Ignavibacteria bacterium]